MGGPFLRHTIPTTTAVASATGANALTATVNAVAGERIVVHGLDVSYSTVGSNQHVNLTNGGVSFWAAYVKDVGHFNFKEPPVITVAQTLQAVCDQPAGSNNGRCIVRYSLSRD